MFFDKVEINCGKRSQNAGYQHFCLYSHVFYTIKKRLQLFGLSVCHLQMFLSWNSLKFCCLGKRKTLVKLYLTHSHTMTPSDAPGKKPFENTVGKGEIARNEQFYLFPQCFLPGLNNFPPFSSNLKLSSANSFSLEESKICHLVMGKDTQTEIKQPIINSLPNNQYFYWSTLKTIL